MQEKWRRRIRWLIRWFLDGFTSSYTVYTKSGAEVRVNVNGGWSAGREDWPQIMAMQLKERARLEAFWRAEREAAEKKQAEENHQQ